MMTVGQPGGRILPVGPGIGATHEACKVISPTRAAGRLPMSTVADPIAIIPGPAGMHAGSMQGVVMSVILAAGRLPISVFGARLIMVSGNGGCAEGVGTGAGGWIGAWQWGPFWSTLSVSRAAGGTGGLLASGRGGRGLS